MHCLAVAHRSNICTSKDDLLYASVCEEFGDAAGNCLPVKVRLRPGNNYQVM